MILDTTSLVVAGASTGPKSLRRHFEVTGLDPNQQARLKSGVFEKIIGNNNVDIVQSSHELQPSKGVLVSSSGNVVT